MNFDLRDALAQQIVTDLEEADLLVLRNIEDYEGVVQLVNRRLEKFIKEKNFA